MNISALSDVMSIEAPAIVPQIAQVTAPAVSAVTIPETAAGTASPSTMKSSPPARAKTASDRRSAANKKRQNSFFGHYVAILSGLVALAGTGLYLNRVPATPARLPGIYYQFPQIVVDLRPDNNRPAYIKVKFVAEVPDREGIDLVRQAQPRIVDGTQAFLREYRRDELVGTQGTELVRRGITRVVNEATAEPSVTILFREIVLQ